MESDSQRNFASDAISLLKEIKKNGVNQTLQGKIQIEQNHRILLALQNPGIDISSPEYQERLQSLRQEIFRMVQG